MVYEFVPTWKCLDCGEQGDARDYIPHQCPKCESTNIDAPPIKKGGPMDDEVEGMKKY